MLYHFAEMIYSFPDSSRPLVPVAIAFAGGIVTAYHFDIPWTFLALALLAVLAAALPAMRYCRSSVFWVLLLLGFFLLGSMGMRSHRENEPAPSPHLPASSTSIRLQGLVIQPPVRRPDRTELAVDLQGFLQEGVLIPCRHRIHLSVVGHGSWMYGDIVRFETRLKPLEGLRNPDLQNRGELLRWKGITARAYVPDPSGVAVVRRNQANSALHAIEEFRTRIRNRIYREAPSPEREIIQAMILGGQQEIPREISDLFNRTGTSHIIAISGFNVGMVALVWIFLARRILSFSTSALLRLDSIRLSYALALPPVLMFALIAGLGTSVVRATIMAAVFLCALILGRERNLFNSLAFAAILILAVFPPSLFDVSFQLSFAAVASILFAAPALASRMERPALSKPGRNPGLRRWRDRLFVFAIVTTVATAGTLPLIAYHFNRISAVVLISNFAVVPLLGFLAIPLSMCIAVLMPFSDLLTSSLIQVVSFLVYLSLQTVRCLADLPWSSFAVGTPTVPEITAYYLLFFTAVSMLDSRNPPPERKHPSRWPNGRRWALLCLGIFFLGDFLYWTVLHDRWNRKLEATFFDVGQGNAALLRFPSGFSMLVDGGNAEKDGFDSGRHILIPYLRRQRIGKIDLVVLTHPHPDHLNGLVSVVEEFPAGEIWTNGARENSDFDQRFHDLIRSRNIPHRVVHANTPVRIINGVRVDFLNPRYPMSSTGAARRTYEDVNDDSLVLRISYGRRSLLLPADISSRMENGLISGGKDVRSDLLLVPHHGSATSTSPSFLQAVQPSVAVISSGYQNRFRLPHPAVLERFSALPCRLFRTDLDGAVSISTDGRSLRFRTQGKVRPSLSGEFLLQ